MKATSLIIGFSFLMISNRSLAQTDTVHINFSIDGKSLRCENATVDFFYNKDTVRVCIQNGRLEIPNSFIKKKATVIFNIRASLITSLKLPMPNFLIFLLFHK
jgi:hypothetical protein